MPRKLPLSALLQKAGSWDFPGGAVVKTASFHCRGHGFDPGQGTKILHTVKPKKKKEKKKKEKTKSREL